MTQRELVLPVDFSDYAWEVEAKGVFWGARVRAGGTLIGVTFYDPVRLQQDVSGELEQEVACELLRTIVVPSVTETNMRVAVDRLSEEFFQ